MNPYFVTQIPLPSSENPKRSNQNLLALTPVPNTYLLCEILNIIHVLQPLLDLP